MATLISDKVEFRTRNIGVHTVWKRLFILIKGSIHEKNIEIVNVYSSNNNTSKYMKNKLI